MFQSRHPAHASCHKHSAPASTSAATQALVYLNSLHHGLTSRTSKGFDKCLLSINAEERHGGYPAGNDGIYFGRPLPDMDAIPIHSTSELV